jgi:tetratricopeptide (TPR) repeat protein
MNGQRTVGRAAVLLVGLLLLAGCGASKEQQAIDAYDRGVAHYENREIDQAIADFTEAIRLNPKYDRAYYNRGIAHVKNGEAAKAGADFAKAGQLWSRPE